MTPYEQFFETLKLRNEELRELQEADRQRRQALRHIMQEMFRQHPIADPKKKASVGKSRARMLSWLRTSKDVANPYTIRGIAQDCMIPEEEIVAVHTLIYG